MVYSLCIQKEDAVHSVYPAAVKPHVSLYFWHSCAKCFPLASAFADNKNSIFFVFLQI